MKKLYGWVFRGVFVVVLVGGLMTVNTVVSSLRDQVHLDQLVLESVPAESSYVAAAQSDLSKRSFDINRIRAFVLDRDTIIEAVSAIEAEGVRNGVAVEVREIEEEFIVDDSGLLVLPPGPLRAIRVKLVSFGESDRLMKLLHSIEHLPYTVHLDTWDLRVGPVRSGQGLVSSIPQDRNVEVEFFSAQLSVDAIILVRKSDGEE